MSMPETRTSVCPEVSTREIQFNDRGRGFNALLVIRAGAAPEIVREGYAALDSFRVRSRSTTAFCTEANRLATGPTSP